MHRVRGIPDQRNPWTDQLRHALQAQREAGCGRQRLHAAGLAAGDTGHFVGECLERQAEQPGRMRVGTRPDHRAQAAGQRQQRQHCVTEEPLAGDAMMWNRAAEVCDHRGVPVVVPFDGDTSPFAHRRAGAIGGDHQRRAQRRAAGKSDRCRTLADTKIDDRIGHAGDRVGTGRDGPFQRARKIGGLAYRRQPWSASIAGVESDAGVAVVTADLHRGHVTGPRAIHALPGADRRQPFDAAGADRVDPAVPAGRCRACLGARRRHPGDAQPGLHEPQHGSRADQACPDDNRIGPGCRPGGGKRNSHHCAFH